MLSAGCREGEKDLRSVEHKYIYVIYVNKDCAGTKNGGHTDIYFVPKILTFWTDGQSDHA